MGCEFDPVALGLEVAEEGGLGGAGVRPEGGGPAQEEGEEESRREGVPG